MNTVIVTQLSFLAAVVALGGCSSASAGPSAASCSERCLGAKTFEAKRTASASSAFWQRWGDGKAELSGFRITTQRYGEARAGRGALIYVTEPLHRRTLVKDDSARGADKLDVVKLNQTLTFDTGIYPYSVITSTFAPVDAHQGQERFSPAKIALSAQEWCGHVYHRLLPQGSRAQSSMRSYFASEGERDEVLSWGGATPLYEDALLIQLRELDGAFNAGRDWKGKLVPTLWATRKAHRALQPVDATIQRSEVTTDDGKAATRFTLRYGNVWRHIDVEKATPRRILGWSASDGEKATLLKTARLPYWSLHGNQHRGERAKLGL